MDTAAFIANLRSRKFTLRADGDALYVEPRKDLTAVDVERIQREKPAILAMLAAQMPTPSLLPDGSVRIGFDCAPKYQWWKPGSQSLAQTLAELGAGEDTIRRYLGKSDAPLHTALGVRDCKGEIVELAELRYCPECGWQEEKKAESLVEVLGF